MLNSPHTVHPHSHSIYNTECTCSLSLASLSSCDSIVRVSISDSLALFTSPLSPLRVTKFDAPHLLKVSRLGILGHNLPDGAALSQVLWAAREPSFHIRGRLELDPGTQAGPLR